MVCFCSLSGASIIVATRPASTCHSMWQWKRKMRKDMLVNSLRKRARGDISGLSALNLRTVYPPDITWMVSRRIGYFGATIVVGSYGVLEGDRAMTWNACPNKSISYVVLWHSFHRFGKLYHASYTSISKVSIKEEYGPYCQGWCPPSAFCRTISTTSPNLRTNGLI
jgi:hypothetical protein